MLSLDLLNFLLFPGNDFTQSIFQVLDSREKRRDQDYKIMDTVLPLQKGFEIVPSLAVHLVKVVDQYKLCQIKTLATQRGYLLSPSMVQGKVGLTTVA